MKSIIEYLSTKVKVSKISHDINDINNLFNDHNITFIDVRESKNFNEITYTFEYSENMFNLVKNYYYNIGERKLDQELHRYTSFDKNLEVKLTHIEANSGNAYTFDVVIKDNKRREIFINCINYIDNRADNRKIIMILKTDSDLDLYENAYILLNYVFEQIP